MQASRIQRESFTEFSQRLELESPLVASGCGMGLEWMAFAAPWKDEAALGEIDEVIFSANLIE
jgi:hypothetical protein